MTLDDLDQRQPDELADEAEIEDEDPDVASDDDDEADDAALAEDEDGEEEAGDQASLEELIAQRAGGRKPGDDAEEDTDIMSLPSQQEEPIVEPIPTKVAPIRDQKEFVCKSCYLVKPRVQMADTKREYCRDCV